MNYCFLLRSICSLSANSYLKFFQNYSLCSPTMFSKTTRSVSIRAYQNATCLNCYLEAEEHCGWDVVPVWQLIYDKNKLFPPSYHQVLSEDNIWNIAKSISNVMYQYWHYGPFPISISYVHMIFNTTAKY